MSHLVNLSAKATTNATVNDADNVVLPGLDALEDGQEAELDAWLRERRVGLLTNPTGATRSGRTACQVLLERGIAVSALFAPEHGPRADQEGDIASERDGGRPVHSLYGATRRPTPAMLDGLDALVYDLQDVGARFYTYSATLFNVLEACAENGVAVIVLDRPTPLGDGVNFGVEGPIIEAELQSFIGPAPLPITHGMTLGELGRWFVAHRNLKVDLRVARVRGWKRTQRWNETNLPWRRPSPNLPDFGAAAWYPGLCLLEFSGVCVGRGTEAPFQILGAPDFAPERFIAAWKNVSDVPVQALEVTPTHAIFENQTIPAVHFGGENPDNAPQQIVGFGCAVMAALRASHPNFHRAAWAKAAPLVGSRAVLERLWNGELESALQIAARDAERFRRQREPFLLYAS